ncbi:MAG: hypothetical protein OEY87_07795 [Gammaproteobacteria bacterium]|nr:hypothetical protein [Gammaproteobacteria bacterium]MDH5736010.1 hypothetical protein [Gammaproteobacteria bacterium]
MLKNYSSQIIKPLIFLFILLPAIVLTSSCSLFNSKEPVDPNDKSLSIVFGYFDMENAPSWGGFDWVSIKQYKPKQAYYSCGVEEGLFWHIGVTNGSSIQVEEFGRNTRWYSNTIYTYNFGGQGRNDTSRIIKKPGAYYLGSYTYKAIESDSFFKPDNFDMVKSKTPTEKQLIIKLIDIMKKDSDLAVYKHQIKLLETRLKQLK